MTSKTPVREYARAIQEAMSQKHANDSGLDKLYDTVKQADLGQTAGDLAHIGGGGLAALMALTALGSGAGVYSWMKNKSKQKILDAAIKKRRRMRTQPQPIYAYPVRVPPPRLNPPIEEDEAA